MRLAATLLAGLLLGLLPSGAGARCVTPGCPELQGLTSVGTMVEPFKTWLKDGSPGMPKIRSTPQKGFLRLYLSQGARTKKGLEGMDIGLTEKDLELFVLDVLRKELPRLKVVKGLLAPSLRVVVEKREANRAGFVFGIKVPTGSSTLRVEVKVLGEFAGWLTKTIWKRVTLLAVPPGDARAWIEGAVTAFAADWNRANPGK